MINAEVNITKNSHELSDHMVTLMMPNHLYHAVVTLKSRSSRIEQGIEEERERGEGGRKGKR